MLSYSRRGTCADPQNRYPCFYIPESTALQQAGPVRKPPTFVASHYTNASRTTSSIVFTNTISMPFVISFEISAISGRFLSGTRTFFICAILAANVFSFNPPIGSTRPLNVISPVMATLAQTFFPVTAESIAVAIVMPADGPSFGTAPSGICKCRSCSLKYLLSTPYRSATERT